MDEKSSKGAYEWEVLRIPRACLDEEFVSPAVQGLETLGVVYVVYQNTAVGSPIECNTQRLKAFLTRSIPNLLITG
jgi:hypothetical protein